MIGREMSEQTHFGSRRDEEEKRTITLLLSRHIRAINEIDRIIENPSQYEYMARKIEERKDEGEKIKKRSLQSEILRIFVDKFIINTLKEHIDIEGINKEGKLSQMIQAEIDLAEETLGTINARIADRETRESALEMRVLLNRLKENPEARGKEVISPSRELIDGEYVLGKNYYDYVELKLNKIPLKGMLARQDIHYDPAEKMVFNNIIRYLREIVESRRKIRSLVEKIENWNPGDDAGTLKKKRKLTYPLDLLNMEELGGRALSTTSDFPRIYSLYLS
jgi:hypothetical protein